MVTWEFAALVAIAWFAGKFSHEALHWILAWSFGGKPEFTNYSWVLPRAVRFHSAESLSDLQIRIAGGGVLVFPLGLLLTAFLITPDQMILALPVVAYFTRASGISDYDIMASYRPSVWRKLSMGEEVRIDQFGEVREEPRLFTAFRSVRSA